MENALPGESPYDSGSKASASWRDRLNFSPLDLLKVVGGLAVLGGFVLHLIGTATHDAYLHEWNVEQALFPKPIDRVMIQGYEGLVASALGLWPKVLTNAVYLLAASLAVSLYWWFLGTVLKQVDDIEGPPRWLQRLPRATQAIVARFVIVTFALVVVPLGVFMLAWVLAGPVILAVSNGKAHAQAEQKQFAKGCTAENTARCLVLLRGTEMVGKGLLIDSSTDYIAIYDVPASGVRVIPRQGLEVRAGVSH